MDVNINSIPKISVETLDISKLLKFNEEGKCTNAYEVIIQQSTLIASYLELKSKPGMMTEGPDEETLDGINMEWFKNMNKLLQNEKYNPKPTRRVYIPKPNGKLRPLGISSARDRLVQQAMKKVMELILEPKFLNTSHGFRPGRSCHTALKEVKDWKGISWIIEGDIKSFFDKIDHHILGELLKKHFKDTKLINLYWKMVKAGYVEWMESKITTTTSDIGVPQGGIISPILSNLILHELDQYVEKIIREWDKKSQESPDKIYNPEYARLNARIAWQNNKLKLLKSKRRIKDQMEKIREGQSRKRKLIQIRWKTPATVPNPDGHPRIRYVRYADDWIIGLWGNKSVAVKLKNMIKLKLEELKLELSEEKTLITNTRSEKAKFLGVGIKKGVRVGLKLTNTKNSTKRSNTGSIRMTAPISKLVEKLENKEIIDTKDGRWITKSIPFLTILPVKDIIIRYRSILFGYLNYYSFVDNKPRLRKIHYILYDSLRKTLSRKLDMSKSGILKRFGKYINTSYKTYSGQLKSINFKCPDLKWTPMTFPGTKLINEEEMFARLKTLRTTSSLGEVCANCGSEDNIEMHHVKHIKTINPKLSTFNKKMAAINRKQIPLCKKCHNKVHHGDKSGKPKTTRTKPKNI